MQERLTIVDRKQGNRIARALKDSFNGICSFNDTLTRSGNGESLRREPPKFMMTNNDTGLQLGSQSSRTNSSPPSPSPFPRKTTKSHSTDIIHSLRVRAEFPSSSSVTRTRRFLKRKLHGYAKLDGSPSGPAAGDADSGKTVCNAESPALSLPANRFFSDPAAASSAPANRLISRDAENIVHSRTRT